MIKGAKNFGNNIQMDQWGNVVKKGKFTYIMILKIVFIQSYIVDV